MREQDEQDEQRENAKEERARRHAENEALVKIMRKLDERELIKYADRLLKRYLKPQ